VVWGVSLSDTGNTSGVDGLPSTLSIDCLSTSRASYLLYRGAWEGQMCKEEVCLLLQAFASFPFSYCLQPGWGRIQDPLDLVFVWCLYLFLFQGEQSTVPPVYLFLRLPDAP